MKFLFHVIVLFLACLASPGIAQQKTLDSLLHQLPQAMDTAKVTLLNQISNQYGFADPAKAIEYAEQAASLAQKLNFSKGKAEAYHFLGSGNYYQNNYTQAIQWHEKALQLHKELGNLKGERLALINLGLIYHKQNNYPKTLEYYLRSLKISEQTGDEALIASALNNMANIYVEQQEYDKALDYYLKSLTLRKKIFKEGRKVSQVLNNIGDIYLKKQQYQQALTYFNLAMEGLTEQDKDQKGIVLANIGITYGGGKDGGLGDYSKALHYLSEALQLHQAAGDQYLMPYTLQSLAYVYQHTNNLDKSIATARQALALAQSLEIKSLIADIYLLLSEVAEKQGKYEQAYQYHKNFVEAQHIVHNDEKTRQIAQLQANYELDKKQTEIELLKKDGELLKKDTERATLVRNGIAAGLLATLLIAGLLLSRQRLKIRQNRLLLEKSAEVAQKNQQLEQQAVILEKQATALAHQTEKLKELDQVKSTFFANISHEFRTPLTLILSNLQDKLAGEQSGESIQVNYSEIRMMHRNANRLLQLINQLLDLSKVESGKMHLAPVKGDLAHFFRVMAGSFSSLAHNRQIEFDLRLPYAALPAFFDEDKLEKIFMNLLSNAFKFTADGGKIHLEVQVHGQEGSAPSLEVVVADNGAGIEAEGLEKVFERFYQGTTYYSDGQGTGIGLALTKELVDLHQGSIQVESEKGKGARFVVHLPYTPATEEALSQRIESYPEISIGTDQRPASATVAVSNPEELNIGLPAGEERPLVLVVEDNEDLRTYIRTKLEATYRVIESENGLKGLEKARVTMPDLIISDWMMPDMDGLQLCSIVKTEECTCHIPVILLTALSATASKLTGLEKGADEYLTKPFDVRELEIRAKNLIDNRQKLRQHYSKKILLQPINIEVTSTDEKFLQRAMQIAESHLGDSTFGAEAFSHEIGMSRMQLHRKLTALTGQSTTDFLRTLRLKRAVKLLEGHTGNITEIAYEVGFNNLSYFAKCFREQYGRSPNEYIAAYQATDSFATR
ncbi:tetratricopeptide repeat protein [Rhodocytophaga aerolata]|uniref:histidine kinase n=1 Tax=Rhodocytophaga aerolata TaxID=455078 RepID=A0ABT8RC07_9BACT|nr:tetratricopeptide repeat protein [Rhodocytophaga aerolata]MDO1448240.1 tetratricopeptide repeat protein [Rhodocytophaga aerolata]